MCNTRAPACILILMVRVDGDILVQKVPITAANVEGEYKCVCV